MSFTLDIEPSSSESTMDDDTKDESSVNQIDEFSDSEEAEIDATNFIIPTQKCVIIPSVPVPCSFTLHHYVSLDRIITYRDVFSMF